MFKKKKMSSIFQKHAKKLAEQEKLRLQQQAPVIGFIPSKANERVGIKYNEADLQKPGTSYQQIIQKRRLAQLNNNPGAVDYMAMSGSEIASAKDPEEQEQQQLETTTCSKRKPKDDWMCDEE